MPAYITHAIMGEEIYNIIKKENIIKENININDLKTYSLGCDLSAFSFCNYQTHNLNTDTFFITLIKYIKDEKLYYNDNIISMLYGHIAHYYLDIFIHPYIYYLEYKYANIVKYNPHNIIEGYLSEYFSEKILNTSIFNIDQSYYNKGEKNKDTKNLLKIIYKKIYKEQDISISYKLTLKAFSLLSKTINNVKNKKIIINISKWNDYLQKTNQTREDIINKNKKIWFNPFNGEFHNESIDELYEKAINKTIETIIDINKYIYDNNNINLENIFNNTSYDTGINCKYGHKFIKQKIKR